MTRRRVAVLVSGRGSNLQALLDAAAAPDYPAEIVLVVSNVAGVRSLDRAQKAGVPAEVLSHRDFPDREAFERALSRRLEQAGVELVCQAGFMRILTPWFVARWHNRLINIHPSLLPAFPGLDTHARALAAGVKLHGCSVHFVRAEVDDGPIIGQAAVPVLTEDSPDRLAARVLQAEHQLYPHCLKLVTQDRVQLTMERVLIPDAQAENALLIHPPLASSGEPTPRR